MYNNGILKRRKKRLIVFLFVKKGV